MASSPSRLVTQFILGIDLLPVVQAHLSNLHLSFFKVVFTRLCLRASASALWTLRKMRLTVVEPRWEQLVFLSINTGNRLVAWITRDSGKSNRLENWLETQDFNCKSSNFDLWFQSQVTSDSLIDLSCGTSIHLRLVLVRLCTFDSITIITSEDRLWIISFEFRK